MQPDPLDRDFATFRASRDPAALAAVFDAAAPRLLLVAMHLCRDAATAEDLVQTVFLQVLRDAGQFDARRPVMPWLLGLLEHRATDLRRRAHARRELGDAERGANAIAAGPGPDREAAAAEARARIAEALAGMPPEYRDVLALRLVHELSAVEIAHAHGVPPATVRTRLRRGLALLRGALPRGLATPGLIALLAAEVATARDGLGAVRAKVLAAAAAGTALPLAFGTWLALAAALLLAAGGAWWFAGETAATTRSAPLPVESTTMAATGEREPSRDAEPHDDSGTAQRVAIRDPRLTTIRGRLIAADTGQPLGGVIAKPSTHPHAGVDEPGWRDPEPIVTAADGTFALAFVPSRHRGVELGFEADGYVPEFLSWEPLREGVEVDAGDVPMHLGTPVRLRLVCGDQPLGGVEVSASHAPEGTRPDGLGVYGRSDADGYIDLGTCEPGPWWHDVDSAHLGAKARFDVPLQRAPLVVTVALHEPPRERSISGVLVDEQGLPMAGVRLGLPWPGGGLVTATTRADGRFLWSIATTPPAHVRERIELVPPPRAGGVALGLPPRSHTPQAPVTTEPALAWLDAGGPIAWGTHDLRLVVRRLATATLRLEVVDAATLQPIETFGATCHAQLSSCSAERRRVAPRHHPGGFATFEVAPGEWFASVFPNEPFAENAELRVQLIEGRVTTRRVLLQRPAELTVEVVATTTGAPLAGVDVALMKAAVAANSREVPATWYRFFRERPGTTGSGGKLAVIVLARGTSDERGQVRLRAPADVRNLVLVTGGTRCVASEHHDIELPPAGADTTIRVVPAAVVHGVLTPRAFVERFGPAPEAIAAAAAKARIEWTDPGEFADEYPRVVLEPVDAPPADCGANTTADGRFAIHAVAAGRYTVHVATGTGERFGPLATITIDPSQDTPPLSLDVGRFLPARGTVQFFVDGMPAAGEASLQRLGAAGANTVRFATDANGTATTPWLLPGEYVALLYPTTEQPTVSPKVASRREGAVLGTERLVVSAGMPFRATISLQRRDVTLTLLGAEGRPARDRVVHGESLDHAAAFPNSLLRGRTDEHGRLVLSSPPGRLRFRVFTLDQDPRVLDAQPALPLGDVAADANAMTFRLAR